MRMITLSIPVALALCVGAAQLSAQQPGNGTFQWYVGGHGGMMNYGTAAGRENAPLGGAHLLVTARRTGLLLSVEQGFDADGAEAGVVVGRQGREGPVGKAEVGADPLEALPRLDLLLRGSGWRLLCGNVRIRAGSSCCGHWRSLRGGRKVEGSGRARARASGAAALPAE